MTLKNQTLIENTADALLVSEEKQLLKSVLKDVSGQCFLQLGLWGHLNSFLSHVQGYWKISIDNQDFKRSLVTPNAFGSLYQLPIKSDSVDVAIMPHTLESKEDSYQIFLEADRVLRMDGYLIYFGFKPGIFFYLEHLINKNKIGSKINQPISSNKLKSWMHLLNFRIKEIYPYCYRLPIGKRKKEYPLRSKKYNLMRWSLFASCYMVVAQKKVHTVTPIKKTWRSSSKVTPSFVKPIAHTCNTHFNEKD